MPQWTVDLDSSYELELNTSSTQDISNNRSTVRWNAYVKRKSGGQQRWGSGTSTWNVSIDGYEFTGSFSSYDFRSSSAKKLGEGSRIINHDADGGKTIQVRAYVDFPSTANIPDGNTGFHGWALPTIPRATNATLSASALNAGQTLTISLPRASTSFTHYAQFIFGGQTILMFENATTSGTWVVPMSLLNQIPSATAGTGTVRIVTQNSSGYVGEVQRSFTFRAPSTVKPTVASVGVSEGNAAVTSAVGALYVQGQSRLNLSRGSVSEAYGSPIVRTEFTIEQPANTVLQRIVATSGTTGTLDVSGALVIRVRVTDARGRYDDATATINVVAWQPPQVNVTSVDRAFSSGTINETGTFVRIAFTSSRSSLIRSSVEQNTHRYRLSYRPIGSTGSYTLDRNLTTIASPYSGAILGVATLAITQAREYLLEVLDDFATTAIIFQVPTAAVFMHWGDPGVGFGKYYTAGRGSIDAALSAYADDGLLLQHAGNEGHALNLLANGVGEAGRAIGWAEALTYSTADSPSELAGAFWSGAGRGTVQGATHDGGWFDAAPNVDFLIEVWLRANLPNSRFYLELRDHTGQMAFFYRPIPGLPSATNSSNGSYVVSNHIVPTTWTKYTCLGVPRSEDLRRVRVAGMYFNHTNGTERNADVGVAIRVQPLRPSGLYLPEQGVAEAQGYVPLSGTLAGNGAQYYDVTFPSGRFTVPPLVQVTSGQTYTYGTVHDITTEGCRVRIHSTNSGSMAMSGSFGWFAKQMTASTASG